VDFGFLFHLEGALITRGFVSERPDLLPLLTTLIHWMEKFIGTEPLWR